MTLKDRKETILPPKVENKKIRSQRCRNLKQEDINIEILLNECYGIIGMEGKWKQTNNNKNTLYQARSNKRKSNMLITRHSEKNKGDNIAYFIFLLILELYFWGNRKLTLIIVYFASNHCLCVCVYVCDEHIKVILMPLFWILEVILFT